MFVMLLVFPCFLFAQTFITGKITEKASGESLVGVQVFYPHASEPIGTLSDANGYFELQVDRVYPFEIEVSLFGYQPQKVMIEEAEQFIEVSLEKQEGQVLVSSLKGGAVIESASRTSQLKQQSPVSVYNLGVLDLNEAPYSDYFQQLSQLKEIQFLSSSLTLGAVSTRGFADIQNWRFVQYIDGVEMNTPGLNYSLGNFLGTSFLDMRNIEIITGTVSALYGANAFNGILSMNTKNPFDYKGVSAFVTGGMTRQEGVDAQPYFEAGVRYGWTMGDKWAAKINVSAFQGHEWEGRDSSYHIRPEVIGRQATLLNLPIGHPNYDAVHVYGDEVTVGVDLTGDGNLVNINRSGFQERDIIDYEVNNIKVNGGIFFRPNTQTEASYTVNLVEADGILRHTTVYPLVNTVSQVHKLELKGKDYFVRGYYSSEDAKDSYQMLGTGAFIQEVLKSSSVWGEEYGAAFRGEVTGVQEGDHATARSYADRDIPGPGSTSFQNARQLTLGNPDITTGGSQFVDQSSLFHVEGAVAYDSLAKDTKLQLGGSFRNYRLSSRGNLFNDGARGFNGPINYQDMGIFAQARKSYLDDRLLFQLALRLDKNSNFNARLSPRFSGVWLLGGENEQTIRFSAQQGFRNPASQEGYIALDLGRLFLLGGLLENIENFALALPGGGEARGVDILESLVTIPSFQAFVAGGQTDPSVLVSQEIPFLKQESITSFELGYRAKLGKYVRDRPTCIPQPLQELCQAGKCL